MNEQSFIQAGNEKNKKEASFEAAKARVTEMEAYIKDLGNKMPRVDSLKIEGDIIYEIMPILEEKIKKLEESLINTEEKVNNAPDADAAEFYQECLKKDKKDAEELKAEIKKYQDILDTFQK